MSEIKLNFHVDETFHAGIARLAPLLGYTCGDGICVTAVAGDKNGVTLCDGKATIYYTKKPVFFRELGILIENLKTASSFSLFEDSYYDCISAMIDASRCAVPTVASVKQLIDRMAIMGYSMIMLYTEDVIALEKRPYFGYMRGRYTAEELREIDDYAYSYGIEAIACLECYGHMGKYLIWPEAAAIKDTAEVLLAREEKTFAFLEELIATAASCFRSRRIHIGMDEAWDMGRGNFLNKNGYVAPFQIFNEYMTRLIGITKKYGLKPMMWSDMYFRVNTDNNGYYNEDTVIPQETIDQIPEDVELVFWHYGEGPHCDDYMLKKHNLLGRKIIFAGGLWGWIGHFPEHNYALESTRFSLNACRNNQVREAMITIWSNDNAECDLFANLYGLSFFAELCYDNNASDEKLARRFEASTGGVARAFYEMSFYHNSFTEKDDYAPRFHDRFLGKPLFWQDIMEGLFDTHLYKKKMSDHYAKAAANMKGLDRSQWGYLYDFACKVFDYLAVKTLIAENLVPAYRADDRKMLEQIASVLLPRLKEKTIAVHEAHKTMWFAHNKVIGWQNLDIRYGGVAARCDTAKMLLENYLSGSLPGLEELDEPRLHKDIFGFQHYSHIATVNNKT